MSPPNVSIKYKHFNTPGKQCVVSIIYILFSGYPYKGAEIIVIIQFFKYFVIRA